MLYESIKNKNVKFIHNWMTTKTMLLKKNAYLLFKGQNWNGQLF